MLRFVSWKISLVPGIRRAFAFLLPIALATAACDISPTPDASDATTGGAGSLNDAASGECLLEQGCVADGGQGGASGHGGAGELGGGAQAGGFAGMQSTAGTAGGGVGGSGPITDGGMNAEGARAAQAQPWTVA